MSIINAKYDHGKAPIGDLIKEYPATFELLAYVLSYSTIKYGFSTGFLYIPGDFAYNQNKIYNSVERHLARPFSIDAETFLPQIIQALTQLLILREREFAEELSDKYVDQVKFLHGEGECRIRNDKAKLNSDPKIWAEKWAAQRKELLDDPLSIPVSEVILRTSHAFDSIAHLDAERKKEPNVLLDKFVHAGNILIDNLNTDEKSSRYDMAARYLMSVIEKKYPEPRIFLR
jgi:hypothetical protein